MNLLSQQAHTPWFHPSRLLLNTLVVSLIVYVALRAAYVSFTHDEAFTFLHYIMRPIEGTLNVTYTNNHLLNSLLARVTSTLFGDSEFSLRLPNVIGGGLFFIFGARLLERMHTNRWLVLGAFVALGFNTFIIDFFGLCRGYGLSLGLLMTGLYYQYRSFSMQRVLMYETIALLFSGAAVLANYTLFNFFLIHACFCILMGTVHLIRQRKEKKKLVFTLVLFLLLLSGIILFTAKVLGMLLHLNQLGNLNFGGSDGFWKDTVDSLAVFSCFPILGDSDWFGHLYLPLSVAVVLCIAAILCVRIFFRKSFSANGIFMLFLFLAVTGCGLAIVLQNKIMHIPFSRDRTVIYFIPLFSLLAISIAFIDHRWNWQRKTIVALFFLPMIVSLLVDLNLREVRMWWRDAEMKQTADLIIEHARSSGSNDLPKVVVTSFDIQPTMEYYLYVNNCSDIQTTTFLQRAWWMVADYAVDYSVASEMYLDSPYSEIGRYSTSIVKVRAPKLSYDSVQQVCFFDFESNKSEGRTSAAGYKSALSDYLLGKHTSSSCSRTTVADTLNLTTVFVCTAQILAEKYPVEVHGVMAIVRNGKAVMWKQYSADPVIREPNQWQNVTLVMHPDQQVLPGDVLEFYFMNQFDEPVRVDNFRVTEYQTR